MPHCPELANVTVGDVLRSLYMNFNNGVSVEEHSNAIASSVSAQFHRRISGSPDDANVQYDKGIKRIDYLLGNNLFNGLRVVDGKWEVLLRRV